MTNNKKVLRLESKRYNFNYQDLMILVDNIFSSNELNKQETINLIVIILIKNIQEVEEILEMIDEIYLSFSTDMC